VAAPLEAEPPPPAGVDEGALFAAVLAALGPELGPVWLQWHEADWPAWARRGWRRLEAAKARCPLPPI
jgi:hypothetical protein